MRVLIVDDHALFRDGLRSLLEAHEIEVVGEASNGRAALELTERERPEIVLMDIQMPVMNGLDATRLICARLPEVRVVMLTASSEDDDVFEAIRSGASGYLSKDLDAAQFVELLNGVVNGEPALSPGIARKVLDELARPRTSPAPPPGSRLTDRERDVLDLLVQGVTSNRDLASRLYVSENTIKFHMRNILDKLHLGNRAQVIAFAAAHPSRRT